MDATVLGVQIFFVILLPGFLSTAGFRLTSGIRGVGGEFATLCYAALCGVILISLMGSGSTAFAKIMANPIPGGVALAIAGFIFGAILGIPVGWLRSRMR